MQLISGIQQIGIGIPNVYKAWDFYREAFGMDIPVFDEAAVAAKMLPYTGGEPRERHAILAINIQGGGGFEIWQYTSRTPVAPSFEVKLGDLGIFVAKIKCKDIQATYNFYQSKSYTLLGKIEKMPDGNKTFYVKDPFNNIFQLVESKEWFENGNYLTGGADGAIVGVRDIDISKRFYADILGYDTVIYDTEGIFDDYKNLAGGDLKVRRVLLTHSKPREGAFSKLLGSSKIELVQVYDRIPKKIYEGRFWGDLGFIQICFDIVGMDNFRHYCKKKGCPFTVDTGDSFDMGEAAGAFAYIEDPDGTLIEFVETHKIPILKKIGWYLNLRKRNPQKPLPNWMLKTLKFTRVK